METALKRILTRETLRRMAGTRSYGLGEDYWTDGQVTGLAEYQNAVTAQVRGTHSYKVRLEAKGDELRYDCSCPFASDEGAFCKHCVAVGLAWLEAGSAQARPGGAKKQKAVTMDDVRGYLESQEPQALVAMLMELAMADTGLRSRLMLRVAQSAQGGPNIATYRKAIQRAAKTGGFVEYDDTRDYAEGLESIAASLRGLLQSGHTETVMGLAEYAIQQIEEHIEEVDDSNGEVSGVLSDLEELHHDACVVGHPEPEALARKLFQLETGSGWTFSDAAGTYADVLGERGLAEYRRVASEAWNSLPPRSPNERTSYGQGWRLAQIMEALARQSGDVEALVAVKKRDLSSPDRYLDIAKVYEQAGQQDEALAWAERGAAAFPSSGPGFMLSGFLVEQYRRRGSHDEALAILWKQFSDQPGLRWYEPLKTYTEPIGRWPEWRERALAVVRAQIEKLPSHSSSRLVRPTDHSALVEIFFWEGEDEAAWQEAQQGGCRANLWLELAGRREKDHPQDALQVYRARIDPLVEQTTGDYTEPVRLLLRIRALAHRLGQDADFAADIQGLRTTYKRKRNLLKLLDEKLGV